MKRIINSLVDEIYTFFMEVGQSLEFEEIYGLAFPAHLGENNQEGLQVLKNLHNNIRDDFLHSLTPLQEYALYHIMIFAQESSDDQFDLKARTNELVKSEAIEEDEEELLLSLDSPYSVIGIVFEDLDFLDVAKLIEIYKVDPKVVSEFFHVDLDLYKELMPQDIQSEYEYIKNEYTPVREPRTVSDFKEIITDMVNTFKHDIEHKQGSSIINGSKGRKMDEKGVQTFFHLLSERYLSQTEIVINPEVSTGRGDVDFYYSFGRSNVALVELKLGSHTRFKNGLQYQLPAYLYAEKIDFGIFILICYEEEELESSKLLYEKAEELSEKYNQDIKFLQVNATGNFMPASKINNENKMGFE